MDLGMHALASEWVAAKGLGLKVSLHYLLCTHIWVVQVKFLNSNPDFCVCLWPRLCFVPPEEPKTSLQEASQVLEDLVCIKLVHLFGVGLKIAVDFLPSISI